MSHTAVTMTASCAMLIIYAGLGALLFGRLADSAAVYSAIAVFRPGIGGGVSGVVRFQKGPNCTVAVKGSLSGMQPNGAYVLRVHEAGDLRGGCGNTGAPWSPRGPSSTAVPAGDLGNVRSDASGIATIEAENPTMSYMGLAELYGRSIVLYNLSNDNLGRGSDPTNTSRGSVGAPVACAVIGTSANAVTSDDCPTWIATDPATDNVDDTGVAAFVADGLGINGSLQFRLLTNCSIQVLGTVRGLRRNSQQASHVHMTGDLTGPCNYTGSHLNPTNALHGSGLTSTSHAGDLGNLRADAVGTALVDLVNPVMSQLSLNSLYGLSVVIHNLTDDLGVGNNSASQSNGNAGTRIACAIIGRSLRVASATGSSGSGTACRHSNATQSAETTPRPTSGVLECRGSSCGTYFATVAVQALLALLLRT